MLVLALLAAACMLAPVVLYLVGALRDPFHPLLFVGVVSYFIAPHRLIFHGPQSLELADADTFAAYLGVSLIAVLGVYAGWAWGGRRPAVVAQCADGSYSVARLVVPAVVFAAVALPVHFITRDSAERFSGYFRDLSSLWIAAAILLIQAVTLAPRRDRLPLLLLLLAAVVPPVERFLNYGQRGDTFRLAALGMLAFLMWRRRPSKPVFVVAAAGLAVVLATIASTRHLVATGQAPDRIRALAQVIPDFFQNHQKADAGDEQIFGAAIVATVRQTGRYGYGLGLTVGLAGRLLPREFFPDKDDYTFFSGGYNRADIRGATGLTIPGGAAPSGFANGFAELSWACPVVWALFAVPYRRLWERARGGDDVPAVGLFTGYTMAMLYAVTQDLLTAEINMLHVLLPLAVVYRFARIRPADEGNGQEAPAEAMQTA
jgi:hypothetical protein